MTSMTGTHRGDCWIRRGVALAAAAAAGALSAGGAVAAEGVQDRTLPDAETIIERYVEAVGGADAIRQHESSTATGTVEMPGMGLEGEMRMYAAKPNRLFMQMEIPGVGEILQGFDGEVGWMKSQMTGPMLMEDQQLADFKREAEFYGELTFTDYYETLEVVERTEFEGTESYHIKATREDGEVVDYFFDAERHLMIGRRSEQETGMGPAKVTMVFESFKDFDGVTMATVIRSKMPGMNQTITITDVTFDDVDEEVFDLPDEVQRLVDRKQQRDEQEAEEDEQGEDAGEGKSAPDEAA